MSEPLIDKKWKEDRKFPIKKFLVAGVPILLLLLAVLFTPFQRCTSLGKVSKEDVYSPADSMEIDKGFVGKTNRILAQLIEDGNDTPATCLDSLNKKYPGLTFALPYGEGGKQTIDAADLRLVAIAPECIKDKDLRNFYFNSRLPQILKQQAEHAANNYFRISISVDRNNLKGNIRPVRIESIRLIPSMFKVALTKNPWKGVIYGNENCLFDTATAVFCSYGNTVIPIHKQTRPAYNAPYNLVVTMKNPGVFTPDEAFTLRHFDIYQYWKEVFAPESASKNATNFNILDNTTDKQSLGHVTLFCSKKYLHISSDCRIRVFQPGEEARFLRAREHAGMAVDSVKIKDGLKLVCYNEQNHKLGEFTLYTTDPSQILSSLIQTNIGTSRYTVARTQSDLFTQQILRGLTLHLSNTDKVDKVQLSIDPLLSLEFEKEIQKYLSELKGQIHAPSNQQHQQYDISLTVMDMATGEVLASPFYTTIFDPKDYPEELKMGVRNCALSRRYVGSTFKPMLALASVMANPRLLDLTTQGKHHADFSREIGRNKYGATFFNRDTYAWAKKAQSHWYGTDFTNFLAHSDDVYPVALAALSMTGERVDNATTTLPVRGKDNFIRLGSNGKLCFEDNTSISLLNHPFTRTLSYLYDANTESAYTTDLHLWDGLFGAGELTQEDREFGLEEVSPDITNLHLDRFQQKGDFRSILVPWVLGQGDNEWNCIKIAEAWSRMVSKQDVRATFLRTDSAASSILCQKNALSNIYRNDISTMNQTWNGFLDKFSAAQGMPGTLVPMHNAVNALGKNLVLFSKTGTPDAYSHSDERLLVGNKRFMDIGMYSFALIDQSQMVNIKANKPSHGIVCIVRITRSYTCARCARLGKCCPSCETFKGLESSHARNFFSSNASRLRMLYDMTNKYFLPRKK